MVVLQNFDTNMPCHLQPRGPVADGPKECHMQVGDAVAGYNELRGI